MMSQGIINKLVALLLFLFLFTSPAMCAEDFRVNVLDKLIILSTDPDSEIQLDIDEGYRFQLFLNVNTNTTWYVDEEVAKTQLGLSDPFLWFETTSGDTVNVTAVSTNILPPFDIVSYTWLINTNNIYYIISPMAPILPTLPPEEIEEDEEDEEDEIIADFVDAVSPPYTGILDNPLTYIIRDGFLIVASVVTQMLTFIFTGNNWFSLLFGFVGAALAGMVSKRGYIVVDIILIGSASIVLILILNMVFSFLNNGFVINSAIFAISCGSIAMLIFNMKEIENMTHVLDA